MKNNFALIGKGKFGENYVRLLSERKDYYLKTIITKKDNLINKLKDLDLKNIIIATPPSTHYSIIKEVIKSKKNILVEKPMVLNLDEAKDLKKRLKNYSNIYMVGFQYIYNNYIQYIKKEIEKDSFGIIEEMKWEHYLSTKRKDITCFFDVAPHALSVFQFLFDPLKIKYIKKENNKSNKNTKDSVFLKIKFDRGPLLIISASWKGTRKIRKITFIKKDGKIILDETKKINKLVINSKGHKEKIKNFKGESLKNQLKQFIYSVKNNKKPKTDINFGYMNTKFLEEISNYINRN